MQIAVVSDIHGNLEALEAVLADIDRLGIGRVFCLGDNIGYGPDPEPVIELLRRRRIPSVIGNHEMAATQPKYLSWFNPSARASLQRTVEMLSANALDYAAALPAFRTAVGARFVHGAPPDSPMTYLFQVPERELTRGFQQREEAMCFVGHTHDLEMVAFSEGELHMERLEQGKRPLDPAARYIVNIGSVGQPRDGDNRAKYVIWEPEAFTLEVRFISYDITAVSEKIIAAGLPRSHALRLF